VLVPAPPPHDRTTATGGQARTVAAQRLEEALARFREVGADARGGVGDVRPMDAIADVLRHKEFDEIILSTLPPGPSLWLRQDLPHRVERVFGLPVSHVVPEPEPVP
jgi:GABA permease